MANRVVVISLAGADEPLLHELPNGTEIMCLDASSSANPLTWWRVYLKLRSLRPDLVLGWSTYANLLAVVVTRFMPHCRVILSERIYLPLMFGRTRSSLIRRSMVFKLMRILYKRADSVTANSRDTVRFLKTYIGTGPAYRILPNVIDVLDASRRAESLASPMLQGIEGPRILALGRLCYQKGFDVLLDALAQVRITHPWTLVIVGDGPEKEALMAKANSLGLGAAVRWMGKASNPFPYYHWADMVVVPSRFEGFPNVPLEAMACGRSVICSDCKTGPRELTAGGRMGVLVPVDDAEALARAILDLGLDPVKRMRLGESARNHVLINHDIGMMRHVYSEVLGLAE
jgi:glycosyltransferase involved in cell wall biosynthesis